MGVAFDIYTWVGFAILWFSLTITLIIGLCIAWKFRSSPAMWVRKRHAQNMMMIICYFDGVGWSLSALILIGEKSKENIVRPFELLLCITFCTCAAQNLYFYRVWILYFRYRLQNEFEKVRELSAEETSTILSPVLDLNSHSGGSIWNSEENQLTDQLIKQPFQYSVRRSWFVRHRWILEGSIAAKALWLFLWICECAVVFVNFTKESDEKKLHWSPSKLAAEFIIFIGWIICFVALFFYPMDDIFLIKIELRIVWLIFTVEIILYQTLLYWAGEISAYISLSLFEFFIMVAIVCTNYQALPFKSSCICSHGRSFNDFDEHFRDKLTMTNILESKRLFRAFEKHLKREFSLEHLNFVVAIVHYKRLCEKRNFKCQNQNEKCTLDDCLKLEEISMQPVCFTDMKNENTLTNSNISTTVTETDYIVIGGMGSELTVWPKHDSRIEKKRGSRRLSDRSAILY